MGEIARIVETAVKREVKLQLVLVYTDIKNLKEENRNLKQKYFEALRRIRALEEAVKTKLEEDPETDFGV